jgi:hypothetical protein
MLNWVDILRRILVLYKVRTQAELGMALGVHLNVGLEGGSDVIPWPVLEKVVADKKVSWDWLLTGKGLEGGPEGTEAAKPPETQPEPKPAPVDNVRSRDPERPLRIETRELARELLGRENNQNAPSREAETREQLKGTSINPVFCRLSAHQALFCES